MLVQLALLVERNLQDALLHYVPFQHAVLRGYQAMNSSSFQRSYSEKECAGLWAQRPVLWKAARLCIYPGEVLVLAPLVLEWNLGVQAEGRWEEYRISRRFPQSIREEESRGARICSERSDQLLQMEVSEEDSR